MFLRIALRSSGDRYIKTVPTDNQESDDEGRSGGNSILQFAGQLQYGILRLVGETEAQLLEFVERWPDAS